MTYAISPDSLNFSNSPNKPKNDYVTKAVTKGPFVITVKSRGSLDSMKNETLSCLVPGKTTIIRLAPEGTYVNKGDFICLLDTSELEEKIKQQQLDLTKAEAALKQAEETLEIQKTQNASDIAKAELNLALAELDLRKYEEGEYLQQKRELDGQLALKQEELTRSKELYEFTKRMAKKGYRSPTDLEAQRIAVNKAQYEHEVQEDKLRVLEQYTKERNLKELRANAEEYVRELDRAKRKAASELAKVTSDFESKKLTLEVEQLQYDERLQYLRDCEITAPSAGEIVYCNESRRRSSDQPSIREGASVYENQAIVKIPDNSQMKVDARVHESMISKVKVGLRAELSIDAFPGVTYSAFVSDVSAVPLSGNWPRYDVKEYGVVLQLNEEEIQADKENKLRPGLTSEFKIFVSERNDVLQIPVQAAVQIGKAYFAYVYNSETGETERRTLKLGETNDLSVEIVDGLSESELVVMNPRTSFSQELLKLESEMKQAEAEQMAKSPGKGGAFSGPGNSGEAMASRGGKAPEGRGKPAGNGGPPQGMGDPAQAFKMLDKNQDQKVTKDELPGPFQERFAQIDSNKDDAISLAEWKKALSKLGAGRTAAPSKSSAAE